MSLSTHFLAEMGGTGRLCWLQHSAPDPGSALGSGDNKNSYSGEEDNPHMSRSGKQRQGDPGEEVAGSGDIIEQEHLCSEQPHCPDRRREADPPAQEVRLPWNQRREVWRHTTKDASPFLSWGESRPSSTLSPGDGQFPARGFGHGHYHFALLAICLLLSLALENHLHYFSSVHSNTWEKDFFLQCHVGVPGCVGSAPPAICGQPDLLKCSLSGEPLVVKDPPVNAGDEGLILWSGRSPGEGNGNPLQ